MTHRVGWIRVSKLFESSAIKPVGGRLAQVMTGPTTTAAVGRFEAGNMTEAVYSWGRTETGHMTYEIVYSTHQKFDQKEHRARALGYGQPIPNHSRTPVM